MDIISFPALEDHDDKLIRDIGDCNLSSVNDHLGRTSPNDMMESGVSPKIYRSCEPATEYRLADSTNDQKMSINNYRDDEEYDESQNNTQLTDQSPPRESQPLRSQYQDKSKLRQSQVKEKKPEKIMTQSLVTKRPTLSDDILLTPLSFGVGGDQSTE